MILKTQPTINWRAAALLILIFSAGAILLAGWMSPVTLGDEVYHYHFAKTSFEQNSRATVDPLYEGHEAVRVRFVTDPLWPMGLTLLWKALGQASQAAAQIYHISYFILLLVSVYFLAKKLYSEEAAFWAVLFAASMPMLVTFGIVLYTDLPAVALLTCAAAFISHKRILAAGLIMAAAFLAKKYVLLFVPALFAFIVCGFWKDKRKIPAALLLFFVPVSLTYFLETSWQFRHIPAMPANMGVDARLRGFYGGLDATGIGFLVQLIVKGLELREYSNSYFFNFSDLIKYFGIPAAGIFTLSFFCCPLQKKEWGIILIMLSYFVGAILMRLYPDIRYLMPMVPYGCILAGRVMPSFGNRLVKAFVILLCFLQMAAAALYVCRERQIPPALEQGFNYIRKNVPEKSLILYPDFTLTGLTGRPIVWGLLRNHFLLWGTEHERFSEIKRIGLDYIAVKKTRTYDDRNSSFRHIGAFPLTFVEFLNSWKAVTTVFDNEMFTVWKINPDEVEKGLADGV